MFSLLYLALVIASAGMSFYAFDTIDSRSLGLAFLGCFLFTMVGAVMAILDDFDMVRNRNKKRDDG